MNRLLQAVVSCGAAVPLLALAAPGVQEVLTPEQYFECQIAAQRATIEGLEDRARMSTRINATGAEKRAAAEASRSRVTMAMHACGKQDAATLGAYAHRNADALQAYLNAHPQVKARMDAQRQRITSLSSQMPAVSPSAKR
jgi:hypothetical protein